MKRIITIILLCCIVISCRKNDDDIDNDSSFIYPEILGTWKRSVDYGGLRGTEQISFSDNSTYGVVLERTEDFNGPCDLDPYCDNDYYGAFWFRGDALYYNSTTQGWTDNWDSWYVEGDQLFLDADVYDKQ